MLVKDDPSLSALSGYADNGPPVLLNLSYLNIVLTMTTHYFDSYMRSSHSGYLIVCYHF